VDAGTIGDALVDEQAVQILCPCGVVADAAPRPDARGQQVRPRGHLHLQQRAEPLILQLPAQCQHPGEAAAFVVADEAHARQAVEQSVLGRADHPGQRHLRPRPLQRVHQRQHVGDVAEGRQP
jgi:hypothetical protein